MRLRTIMFCLFISQLANSQSTLPSYGNFTPEEINLKECPFDKNAEAVVLLDDAVADHDDQYHLVTHRRVRIKILNQHEADRANIRIPFYSKGGFEYIENVRGVTFNQENGTPVMSYLDNKSIFTDKANNVISYVKFALPGVKAGSIIEYEYDSYMKNYGGLSGWTFQQDIPVLKSCYLLTIIPDAEFQYTVRKKPNYPITIKPIPTEGKIYFEMDNLPGLKFEPYMDAINDYLQQVDFQLSQYTNRSGGTTKVNQTWKDLGNDLLSDHDFGGAIKKDLPKLDEVKDLVSKETSDSGKIAAIYNYVRTRFTWNGYDSKYAPDGLKKAWESRTGSAGEINLLLLNLLQSFNIEAYPMLVAERDFGKIDSTYPYIDRFNKVAAYARANGKTFLMDATQKYCPPGLTPFPLLNTVAFVLDKKNYRLIRILTAGKTYNNVITVDARIDNSGMMKGTAVINSSDYARLVRTEKLKEDQKDFVKEMIQEPGSELVVDDFSYDNIDDDTKPLVQKIAFHNEMNASGGFVFVLYNMFMGLSKNPFTASERFTNVNFGYPYKITLEASFHLPEKSKIDKLPDDKVLTSTDNTISLYKKLRLENNTLTVTIDFEQNSTLVPFDEYDSLKYFYKVLIEAMSDPVTVKISQ